MAGNAHQRHPRNLVSKSYDTWFDSSIRILDRRATTTEIMRWLHDRATYHQVLNWRRGLAKPPQWAVDCLSELLRQHSQTAAQAASSGEAGPGSNGTVALHNYRRKRALERETKTS